MILSPEETITDQSKLYDLLIDLKFAIRDLQERMIDDRFRCWDWINGFSAASRKEATRAINNIYYEDGQSFNESRIFPALIPSSAETLAAVDILNQCRDSLKRFFKSISDVNVAISGSYLRLDRHLLRQTGHGRFHKLQATRHLLSLHLKPDYISYFWAHTPRIHSVDRSRLLEVVESRQLEHLPHVRMVIEGLPDDKYALFEKRQTNVRVNIHTSSRIISRPAIAPIFYLQKEDEFPLDFRPLAPYNEILSRERGKYRTEEDPLFNYGNLLIYRYRRDL